MAPALYIERSPQMNYETRKYRITGTQPILGSCPANPDVYSAYIASKATNKSVVDAELDALPVDKDKGITVFMLDPHNGALALRSHVIKGFLKEAGRILSNDHGVKQIQSKVDNLVFISEVFIPIMNSAGDLVKEPNDILQRPLRAMTMQGPRVSVVGSEMVDDWMIEFTMKLLDNDATKTSPALTFDTIDSILEYGELKGLGQWRNGDYGRFTFEAVE